MIENSVLNWEEFVNYYEKNYPQIVMELVDSKGQFFIDYVMDEKWFRIPVPAGWNDLLHIAMNKGFNLGKEMTQTKLREALGMK